MKTSDFNNTRRRLMAGGAATLVAMGWAAAAQAADAGPAAPAAPAPAPDIVVTAQKTSQRIVDVPINVTSVSARDIHALRVIDATDLPLVTPNVDVKENIPGAQSIITVRGVGLDDFSSTNNSSVGVYYDDVFLASFAEMDFKLYDVGRIEVLKGPQGTLYGRNSTAGAINIISARPSLAGFSANLTASYGNYSTFDADGAVNLPVSDNLAVRLSAMTIQQDQGYWYSRVLRTDLGRQDDNLGRFQALWTPTSRLTVLFKLEGEVDRSSIGVGKFFGTIPVPGYTGACPNFSAPANCVNSHGYTDTTPNPFDGDWNHSAPYDVNQLNATLHVDDDLGWARLSSITGYIDFRRSFYTDADAGPTTDAEFDENDHVEQFSQELHLAGTTAGVQWITGAYYSWDSVVTRTPGYLTDLFNTDVLIKANQDTETAALFGQAKWPITDALSLDTGLRFTDEQRHYVGGTTDTNPNGASFLCYVAGDCGPPPNPGTYALSFEDATIHDDNWSWRAALDWKPTRDSLIYASISRGTKSGGFFNGITTTSAALAPYKPEQLTDYEVGANAQLFDRTLQIESSLFYYDYDDLQAQTFTNVGAVSLIKLGNIPHATIYGADLAATWTPIEGLTLRGGLGLLHSELGAFKVGTATTVRAGNKLPDAPDVSFNGLIRYEHPLFDGLVAAAQLAPQYSSAVFKEALNTPYLSADAYWLFDARVSVSTADHAWEVAVWGKNITNTRYVTQATDDGLGMGYRVFNAPVTYGVSLSHQF
jgi:iron complex outermembrane receptor protein